MGPLLVDPQEFTDLGKGILVTGNQYGVGAASGLEIEEPWYAVFTFREDVVVALSMSPDRHDALNAAGLEE